MIRLDGAVETSIRLGLAYVIADVVETGSTLRQQGLEIVGEPILRRSQSCARLGRRRRSGTGCGRRESSICTYVAYPLFGGVLALIMLSRFP